MHSPAGGQWYIMRLNVAFTGKSANSEELPRIYYITETFAI